MINRRSPIRLAIRRYCLRPVEFNEYNPLVCRVLAQRAVEQISNARRIPGLAGAVRCRGDGLCLYGEFSASDLMRRGEFAVRDGPGTFVFEFDGETCFGEGADDRGFVQCPLECLRIP